MAARKASSAKAPAAKKAAAPRKAAKKRAPTKRAPKRKTPAAEEVVAAFGAWRDYTLLTELEKELRAPPVRAFSTIAAVLGLALDEPDQAVEALLTFGRPEQGPVQRAVERDLAAIAKRDADLALSGLAASAVAMANELDDPNSATSKSMCAARLREALDRLRELAPDEVRGDGVDELERRRLERQRKAAISG